MPFWPPGPRLRSITTRAVKGYVIISTRIRRTRLIYHFTPMACNEVFRVLAVD